LKFPTTWSTCLLEASGQLKGMAVTIGEDGEDGEDGVENMAGLVVERIILVASTIVIITSGEDETTGELAETEEDAAALLAVGTESDEIAVEVIFVPVVAGVSVTVVKAVNILVSVT
jgi:hypothetical protein